MATHQKVTVNLPTLHPVQQACLNSAKRLNVVAGGEDSGKTTLGFEALLMGPNGALNSKRPIAFISPTNDANDEARRHVVRALGGLVKRRVNARRIELSTGGQIDFLSLEQSRDIFEQYALIVVDDAYTIPQFFDLWEDTLLPCLQQFRGKAWVLSGAYGKKNDFYKLWQLAGNGGDYARHQMDSFENPYLPEETKKAALEVTDTEYAQRFCAEFLEVAVEFSAEQRLIRTGETFLMWCERLEQTGLKVDGHPFQLSDRPSMRFIYDLIPNTIEDAFGRVDVIMKCTQVGFTVFEMLAMIYLSLRFSPAKIGMFMPSQLLASGKSSERFLPILRSMPEVYALVLDDKANKGRRGGEGNVLIRNLGSSRFHFLWTTGKTSTESFPMDIVSFDEVQEMAIADMEKVRERMSASNLRYTLMGSTANWPDSDIHWWYVRGQQWQLHTECPHCGTMQVLDEHFPDCIGYDPDHPRAVIRPGDKPILGEYRYRCHECSGWIDDPQAGEWIAKFPERENRSVHYPQFLSPTISPREIITAYHDADDMKNFFNRKLGKPYTDPTQVPVNLEILNECAKLGMEAGVQWKARAKGTFMGLDQMGSFIVAIIKERLPDGRQAVIHVEYIFIAPTKETPDASPWDRAGELMDIYGVQCCVVETLPNYDSAKSFARRFDGRVFLAGYAEIKEEMMRWGDTPTADASDRRTADEARDKFTVTLDQYKCMQVSMSRFQKRMCLFPDPEGLVQEVLEKGKRRLAAVCKEYAFFHFTRTALVAEKDEEERKFKRRVVKVGIDPHTSYANMLCDVAWARAYGTNMFILPEPERAGDRSVQHALENYTPALNDAIQETLAIKSEVCGGCASFENGVCGERLGLLVKPEDRGCVLYSGV